jgi:GNAT superfamily N-acetyltransferase
MTQGNEMPDPTIGGLRITSSDQVDEAGLQVILAGLRAYNEQHAGPANFTRVNLFLRDASGAVQGGLIGRRAWNWLFVELLWVAEELRGQGFGGRLLDQAEREARAAGCTRVLLDTFEFQARPFYEARGYRVFGVLDEFPPGFHRYYLWKNLEEREISEPKS